MKQVLPPEKTAVNVCGIQKVNCGPYRFSTYVFRVLCKYGALLYNTMTCELIQLTAQEEEYLQKRKAYIVDVSESKHILIQGEPYRQTCEYLIMHWFMVPDTYDEYAYATQYRNLLKIMVPARPGITAFRIFTTTDCNARCFYCYEAGCRKVNMSVQTACDVAEYIERVSGRNDIKITWFGGEPMMNPKVIDIITNELHRRDIEYTTGMVSNGLLFDLNSVKKAVKNWNLDHIQITLDGTENVYNRTKGYINVAGSAYQRVLSNINLFLSYGVKVNIRLNMSRQNAEDLSNLVEELIERFSGTTKPSVYIAQIKNYGFKNLRSDSYDLQAEMNLSEKLAAAGLLRKQILPRKLRMQNCMADNDSAITITPDGSIGKCEHFFESHLIGNINSDSFNSNEVSYWKERIHIKECQTCLLYPSCTNLKNCPTFRDGCSKYDRMKMEWILRCKILNVYDAYCSNNAY